MVWRRPRRAVVAVSLSIAAALAAASLSGVVDATSTAPATPASARPAGGAVIDPAVLEAPTPSPVVVMAAEGARKSAEEAVRLAGGTVRESLPLVGGFGATLSAESAAELVGSESIVSVTLDRVGTFEEFSYDSATLASNFVRTTGASAAWAQGNTGRGVGVAVIDTGIANHNDFAGRLVHGPDLSGEGRTIDSYGHGTVMAGIIGGTGADSATGAAYRGIAPGATLVGVKVAGRNGAVDVSTVLQAMHWIAAYKDQFNIRVLSLSWGVPSTQSAGVDPVNYAVERLWDLGIVVVVSAGNDGPQAGTILKPADDPVVLSVGAYDDKQNTDPADDSVSAWSARGSSTLAKPDLVAPGRYIVAARALGSYVEQNNPKALYSPSYIRGSGTSQAAAVAAGAAALLVAARPTLTPDEVKNVLKSTASPIANFTSTDQGAGRMRLDLALAATPDPAFVQTARSTGLGSINASRGGRYVQTDCGNDGTIDVILGEIDVRCETWNGSAWTGSAWTGSAWTGSAWTGSAWTGSAWTGSAWTGSAWTGSAWTGGYWTGSAWTGSAWTGSAWTGSAWTGSAWTGSAWTGSAWTGSAWTGSAWTGAVYDDLYESTFQTAFWGARPPIGLIIPGEPFVLGPR